MTLKTVLLAGAVALAVTPALADETETAGTVTYKIQSSTDLGNGLARTTSSGTLKAAKAGDPFNGSTHTCTGLYQDGNALAGTCDAVDKDGDAWVLSWVGFGDGTGNTWEVTWGSGKYATMVGGGTTETKPGEEEGTTVLNWEGTFDMSPPEEPMDDMDDAGDDSDEPADDN